MGEAQNIRKRFFIRNAFLSLLLASSRIIAGGLSQIHGAISWSNLESFSSENLSCASVCQQISTLLP